MLLSKLSSMNAWKNRFNKVHSKPRQRLSTPCFLSNTSKVNLYAEVFKIQIYSTVKSMSVFSHLRAPYGGDLSIEVYVVRFFYFTYARGSISFWMIFLYAALYIGLYLLGRFK